MAQLDLAPSSFFKLDQKSLVLSLQSLLFKRVVRDCRHCGKKLGEQIAVGGVLLIEGLAQNFYHFGLLVLLDVHLFEHLVRALLLLGQGLNLRGLFLD